MFSLSSAARPNCGVRHPHCFFFTQVPAAALWKDALAGGEPQLFWTEWTVVPLPDRTTRSLLPAGHREVIIRSKLVGKAEIRLEQLHTLFGCLIHLRIAAVNGFLFEGNDCRSVAFD